MTPKNWLKNLFLQGFPQKWTQTIDENAYFYRVFHRKEPKYFYSVFLGDPLGLNWVHFRATFGVTPPLFEDPAEPIWPNISENGQFQD